MLDLDELEASIAEGEKKNFFVAPLVKQLIAELRELRSMRRADNEDITQAYDFARNKGEALERQAVVAWLRRAPALRHYASCIERGEHLRKEEA
jgi:hypothetical protein